MITLRDVALSDRYDLAKSPVLLSGTQGLVRACLMQAARDAAAGVDTAGYVTGYRGSPLGAVDGVFLAASGVLDAARIRFHPGLNEDLAATALWGTQQAGLRGEGRHDGVFGLWYGKGPGVDRSGDVLRHANLAGSAALGGVVAVMGDDHTCESSTTCHQSDLAMIDAMLPILSPAGVQDLVDYALHGWALSRHCGLWVGLKAMKDTVEATAVIDGDPHRLAIVVPDGPDLGIRLHDTPQAQEARLHDRKIAAAHAYARANRLDRPGPSRPGARVGVIAAGKSWLDLVHALGMLGADAAVATYKLGMIWPVEPDALRAWADGLDLIVVVEEKRPVIEGQVKEILFNLPTRPAVVGKRDLGGAELFSPKMDLSPAEIAAGLARLLGLAHALAPAPAMPMLAERKPWFCAGCPHNSSTRLPEGARAYAGIGCHYMVQWMDRATEGYTHMGGEGANWIGEAPFSTRTHVFQNMGDGTYTHSGLMAIRAAVAAGVNVTFKLLYNDAVAMTGGQAHDGDLTPHRIAAEVLAAGVARVVAVVDLKEGVPLLPPGVPLRPRDDLMAVQAELAAVPGVTVLIYVQTCAAEKRRRRRRGLAPDPVERVFINPSVCEGCGDCGVQSNCVAILPLETPLGRKRQIDQSACNKDFSCLKGFCPSFVTVAGAVPKRPGALAVPALPEPAPPPLTRVHSLLITGVGGTGVVTVGALLTMAAHLEGKAACEMQMAGLAQKGGAVAIHCRLAPSPEDITAIRLQPGEADAVIGGDLVVTAAPKSLGMMAPGVTRAVVNSDVMPTGAFTHDIEARVPQAALARAVASRIGPDRVIGLDATRAAERLLGDAIYANVLLLGAAWQAGMVPLSLAALRRAIELNGAGVEGNLAAFDLGRWAVVDPGAVAALLDPVAAPETLAQKIERRAAHLVGYQNAALAVRYRVLVARAAAAGGEGLAEAVAEGYFKLLSYKDEYEVARLHAQTLDAALAGAFDHVGRVTYHLAPPILGARDGQGCPAKRRFGPWMAVAFRALAALKGLRGTALDPFGRTAERRAERAAIAEYEALMEEVLAAPAPGRAVALARLPLKLRGFGHVKAANAARVAEERAVLLHQFRAGDAPEALAAQ